MKLSDLTPCDGCGGPLFTPPGRWFQVVRTTGALVTPAGVEIVQAAARQAVPLHRLEADRGSTSVVVVGDREPRLLDEVKLCVTCYHDRPIAEIARRRRERLELEVSRVRAS